MGGLFWLAIPSLLEATPGIYLERATVSDDGLGPAEWVPARLRSLLPGFALGLRILTVIGISHRSIVLGTRVWLHG